MNDWNELQSLDVQTAIELLERGVEVEVPVGTVTLAGQLTLPENADGIVIFAHGSGSSRHSPRNQYVAEVLQRAGHGTLLFDLLTKAEENEDYYTRHLRFDIGMLAGRLSAVTSWVTRQPALHTLPIGYFGASTGAAAALVAAADLPREVKAVVSRGGRPDLAGAALHRVQAPTLLIIGGFDYPVIRMNEEAYEKIPALKEMVIVPGATHLFEEPGTLNQAAELARDWFSEHLVV